MFPEIPLSVKQCRRVKPVSGVEGFIGKEIFVAHLHHFDFFIGVQRLDMCLLATADRDHFLGRIAGLFPQFAAGRHLRIGFAGIQDTAGYA